MVYLNSYKLFEFKSVWHKGMYKESHNWTPEEILKELSLPLSDAGLKISFLDNGKIPVSIAGKHLKNISNEFYMSIDDVENIFCKNYPQDDMDWLYNKPIMIDFYKELEDFGFRRDIDYVIYGGGAEVNIVFKNKNIIKL